MSVDNFSLRKVQLEATEYVNKDILFMYPILKQKPWGGKKLEEEWHYQTIENNIGECWAVSAHPKGDCTIKGGEYDGYTLSKLWKIKPELFGNIGLDNFPLLVKIIEAEGYSSIQVHPDAAYAKAHEKDSFGKTECWYVLDSKADSKLIIGHNASTSDAFKGMIRNNEWDKLLQEVHVDKGDFIQIEPGTIHSFGGGMLLLEIQQSSDLTYRVYDYDRLVDGKPRELHIDKALDIIDIPSKLPEEYIKKTENMPENVMNLLVECDYYKVWKIDITAPVTIKQNQPFMIVSVTAGEGFINGVRIQKGDNFILPYEYGDMNFIGNMQLIVSSCNIY